jgi:hypothetical protein
MCMRRLETVEVRLISHQCDRERPASGRQGDRAARTTAVMSWVCSLRN